MIPRLSRVIAILLFLTGGIGASQAASPSDPDKDPAISKLLEEANALAEAKKLPAAVDKCDKVIAVFKASYGTRKEKIYCGRSPAERLGYLLKAAAEIDKGRAQKPGAIALSPTWADACFVKAYALQDMGRMAEARRSLNSALELSPYNPHYLCELGEMYELEKNWPKAKAAFLEAEDNAPLSADDIKAADLAKARRGLGYVYVELGQLPEAEKKYRQCLATDPHDTRAARELEYVKGLMEKTKSR